jgi:hypothetical protein
MKPGYKTTEFWVAIIISVATFVASIADALGPRYAAISSAVVGAGYAVARGLAKVFPPKPNG